MKNGPFIWMLAGLAIGTTTGLLFGNIPAGICLGTATGLLAMLVSLPGTERKNRN